VALLASGCGSTASNPSSSPSSAPKGKVVIGAFNFAESELLSQLYGGGLRGAGYTVTVRPNLGNRLVVEPALERGEIDLYAGYAATDLEFINKAKGEATSDPAANVAKLNTYLKGKDLVALNPAPATDQNAFAVPKATASKYHLAKLSDLEPVAGQLVFGGPPECVTGIYCAKGLANTYGIHFKSFQSLDAGGPLTKAALDRGDIQVGLVFTTSPGFAGGDYLLLQDDKHLLAADNVTPIGRQKVLTGEVATILNRISAGLTTADLLAMDKKVGPDRQDPSTVANEYLKSKGIKAA